MTPVDRRGARSGRPLSAPALTDKPTVPAPAVVPVAPIRTHEATRPKLTIPAPPIGSMASMMLGGFSVAALRGMLPVIEMKAKEALEKAEAPDYVCEAVEDLITAIKAWGAQEDRVITQKLNAAQNSESATEDESKAGDSEPGE